MSKSSAPPERQPWKDTQWISQGRDLGNRGYQGIVDNYNRVNVFDPLTQKSIQDTTNAVYQRAEDDFARNYRDTMRNLDTRNYNRFGTLNATAPAYVRDMQNLQSQRQLMDSAYNKALYSEQLKDQELARRYNTLNMFENLYGYGKLGSDLDLKNQEIAYQNAYNNWLYNQQQGNPTGDILGTVLPIAGAVGGAFLGNPMLGYQLGSLGGSTVKSFMK